MSEESVSASLLSCVRVLRGVRTPHSDFVLLPVCCGNDAVLKREEDCRRDGIVEGAVLLKGVGDASLAHAALADLEPRVVAKNTEEQ